MAETSCGWRECVLHTGGQENLWGEGTSDVNPMKEPAYGVTGTGQNRQRVQQSARILWRESNEKEANIRKWSVRVGRGSGLMGLCRPWYQLGFYSELGEKIVRKRRAKMKIQKNKTVSLVWYEMNITYFKSSKWLWGKDQCISIFHVRKWQA